MLKSALLPSLPKDDRPVSRSRKRQRLHINGASTDPNALEDSECGIVLETSKECFLLVRHGKNAQSAGVDGVNEATSEKPMFTISLIQGEVEVMGGAATSVPTTTSNPEDLTPVTEVPKSPLPAPEQPTKEPSPVEPLPPAPTPLGVKQIVQDQERGRSTSVVDMELDTPASITPTATAGPDIPSLEKALLTSGEPEQRQDAVSQDVKPPAPGEKPQPEEKALPTESGSVNALSKPPSPTSATNDEAARVELPPPTSAPVPEPDAQGSLQVKLKLQILQRNIRGEDLVFGDDGLGVLSAEVNPLDNTKKGWLIEAPLWKRYNGRFSDCIIVC